MENLKKQLEKPKTTTEEDGKENVIHKRTNYTTKCYSVR